MANLLKDLLSQPPEERKPLLEQRLHEILGVPLDLRAPAGTLGVGPAPDFSALAEDAAGIPHPRSDPRKEPAPAPLDFSALAEDPAQDPMSFTDSVGRGVDVMQGMLYGGAEATGELLGSEGLTEFGKEGRISNEAEADQYGTRSKFSDIGSVGDLGQWMKETVGEQIPIMAPSMGGGLAGAGIGGAVAGPPGALIGGLLGAFVPSFAMGVGETQQAIKGKDPEAVAPGWAFAGGSAIAALDSVLPGKVGGALVKRFGLAAAEEIAKKTLEKPVKSGIIKRTAKGAAEGIATEGITEALQEAIGEVAAAQGAGQDINWSGMGEQMLEAGAAGALMGGLAGGGSAAVQTERDAKPAAEPRYARINDPGGALHGEEVLIDPDQSDVDAGVATAVRLGNGQRLAVGNRTLEPVSGQQPPPAAQEPAEAAPVETAQPTGEVPAAPVAQPGAPAGDVSRETPDFSAQADDGYTPAPATPAETAILRAAGYSDEDIADMEPEQRAQEIEDARDAGVNPVAEGTPGTRSAPVKNPQTAAEVDQAAIHATEPKSPEQATAGNQKKGHIENLHGVDIAIENAKGSIRRNKDPKGPKWEVEMPATYGYIKGTKSNDGAEVDVYIGDNPQSTRAFIVDQKDLDTGKYDEAKVILGVDSLDQAEALYEAGFSDGKGLSRLGAITEMSTAEFTDWAKSGDQTKPLVYEAPKSEDAEEAKKPAPAETADTILSALAKFLRQEGQIAHRPGPDGTSILSIDGKDLAEVSGRPTNETAIEAIAGKLREALKAEGRALEADPSRMNLDEFTLAHQLRGMFPEVEIGADEIGTVVKPGPGGALTVDVRELYNKFQRENAPKQIEKPDNVVDITKNKPKAPEKTAESLIDDAFDTAFDAGLDEAVPARTEEPKKQAAAAAVPQKTAADPARIRKALSDYLKGSGSLDPEVVGKALGITPKQAQSALLDAVSRNQVEVTKNNRFRRTGTRKAPVGLLEFIASRGGIKDDGGELAAMDLTDHFVPGAGRLVRKRGLSPDRVREMAVEAGYFGAADRANPDREATSTLQDLWDAIAEEAAGTKVLTEDARAEQAARDDDATDANADLIAQYGSEEEARLAQLPQALRDWLSENDINLKDIDGDVIAEAAPEIEKGVDADTAIERAFVVVVEREGMGDALDPEIEQEDIPYDEGLTGSVSEDGAQSEPESADGKEREDQGKGGEPRPDSETDRESRPEPEPEKDDSVAEKEPEPSTDASQITTEKTEAGEQTVLPGAEKIPEKEQAEREGDKPLKGKKPQKGADEKGLFGSDKDQGDLVDMAKKPAPETPATAQQEADAARERFDTYLAEHKGVKSVRFVLDLSPEAADILLKGAVEDGRLIATKKTRKSEAGYRYKPKGYDERIAKLKAAAEERRRGNEDWIGDLEDGAHEAVNAELRRIEKDVDETPTGKAIAQFLLLVRQGMTPAKALAEVKQDAGSTEINRVLLGLRRRVQDAAKGEAGTETSSPDSATVNRHGTLLIGEGDILKSKSGRIMAPAPKIDATSDRKTNAAIKRMDAWLLEEAKKEYPQGILWKGMDPDRFSQSDRDLVNDTLFGADGATAENFVHSGADAAILALADAMASQAKTPSSKLVPSKDIRKRLVDEGYAKGSKLVLTEKGVARAAELGTPVEGVEPETKAGARAAKVIKEKKEADEAKERLEDAGEKIGGARKDQWARRGLSIADIKDMTPAEIAKHVTKEEVFPRPDYASLVDEEGVDPVAAHIIKQVYDGLPVKPVYFMKTTRRDETGKRLSGSSTDEVPAEAYIHALRALRDVIRGVKTVEDANAINRNFETAIEAVAPETAFDHEELKSTTRKRTGRYRTKGISDVLRRAEWKATQAVEAGFPNQEPWQRLYRVAQFHKGDWGVVAAGRQSRALYAQDLATEEEAVARAKALYDEHVKAKAAGDQEPKRPHLDRIERAGPDHRKGKDVTSEDFIDTFGFRGVEFGNWVAGDERQKVVNLAYDALHDLARATGIPHKALSLDGTLGVGFGSRGRGGKASAHYESHLLVINMTKLSGAGALAHEWGHALDHYLGEAYSSNPYSGEPHSASGWRETPPIQGVNWAIASAMPKRLSKPLNDLIRAFFFAPESDEKTVADLKQTLDDRKRGLNNWIAERERIKERIRNGKGRKGLAKADEQIEVWTRTVRHLERQMEAGKVKRKEGESEYFRAAKKLSGKSGSQGYWTRPTEMFARAFEAYVHDRLDAEGHKSQYLVQGVEANRFGNGYKGNPYPAGAERDAINEAFDRTFRALTTGKGKLGEGTRLVGAEGEPEVSKTAVSEYVEITGNDAVESQEDEMKALDESSDQAVTDPAGQNEDILADRFAAHFGDGNTFKTIVEARKFAKDAGFDLDNKAVDEAIELGVVKRARDIAANSGYTAGVAYDDMVTLYGQQPNLSTRTATSVTNQAYSTPVPLAYLASRLARVSEAETVFEPSAGNGALLIEVFPGRDQAAIANEIDPTRIENLKKLGFVARSTDATDPALAQTIKETTGADAVIMNPPFGAVREGGESKSWTVGDLTTTQIDHAIAMQALNAMADNGRAVLILGGVNAEDTMERRKGYRGEAKRVFFKKLYDRYNVVDHFTVAGELYQKQGAGWPVDVVVIDGRGKSEQRLPAAVPPTIFKSWADLKEKLPDASAQQRTRDEGPRSGEDRGPSDRAAEAVSEPEAGDGGSGRGDGARGPDRRGGDPDGQPGGLRGSADRGQPADGGSPAGSPDDVRSQGDRDRGGADEPPGTEGGPSGVTAENLIDDAFGDQFGEPEPSNDSDFDDETSGEIDPDDTDQFSAYVGDFGWERLGYSDNGDEYAIREGFEEENGVEKAWRQIRIFPNEMTGHDDTVNPTDVFTWHVNRLQELDDLTIEFSTHWTSRGHYNEPADWPNSMQDLWAIHGKAISEALASRRQIARPSKQSSAPQGQPRSLPDLTKSAAKNLTEGTGDFLAGLDALFNDPKKLTSGIGFDEETYAKAKPLFLAAVEKYKLGVKDIAEIAKRLVADLVKTYQWTRERAEAMRPYLVRFIDEVMKGSVRLARDAAPQTNTTGQTAYVAQSRGQTLGTLVPANMADATRVALDALEARIGSLDTFVAGKLGYETDSDGIPIFMRDGEVQYPFSAEQVDAISLAIDNIERGRGFIIGDQCVAGETRIFNPLTGEYVRIDRLIGKKHSVVALTPRGFEVQVATRTFKKGRADLYRVTLADGRNITVTRQHRFLTPAGWMSIETGVSVGTSLAVARDADTTSSPIHASCVRSGTKKPQDCLDRYCRGRRRGGGRPLTDAGIDPAYAQLQGDALERILVSLHRDARGVSQAHSRASLDDGLRSKKSCAPLGSRDRAPTSAHVSSSAERLKPPTHRNAPRSGLWSSAAHRVAAQVLEYSRASSSTDLMAAAEHPPSSNDNRSSQRSLRGDRPTRVLSTPVDIRQLSLPNPAWGVVSSIEFVRHDDFYDMYVPGHENYMAEGFVNHNTGIGKGRTGAGIIRYALKQDNAVPIFVTESPDLYGDMFRDMTDIGMAEFLGHEPRVLMTNTNESVPLDEEALAWKSEAMQAKADGEKQPPRRGKFLISGKAEKVNASLKAVSDNDSHDWDAVFTTYAQMNSVKGKDTPRREFLRAVAPRAIVIMDETHNAGGTGGEDRGPKNNKDGTPRAENRAEFARKLVRAAKGVMYSSATYAKRPEVMDLYVRTDMGLAVDKPSDLAGLIQSGGVPLQQIVASMLSRAGQYLRRERSFEGVSYEVDPVPVSEGAYADFSTAIRAVFQFDMAVKEERDDFVQGILDDLGGKTMKDGGVGEAGAYSTAFASIMHNVIGQMLLGIKADIVANRVIAAIEAGEKPVVGLSNTMEAFITDFAKDENFKIGDEINIGFADVLSRYLARTLRVTVKDEDGNKEHVWIPAEKLPLHLQEMYRETIDIVAAGDYGDIPVSPIDWIRHRVEQAGYSISEITGRSTMLDYTSGVPVLVNRPSKEKGVAGKRSSISAFNSGRLHAVIINRSGSTGVSMHASKDFKDKRKRRMILAQADPNIDTHMQMLGRIHRTGQVELPLYTQIVADIPAEARPTAVLMKKMASLNANTTASRKSVFMGEAMDFINAYGDRVVGEIMGEDPELNASLGWPIDWDENGRMTTEDPARKVTGRLVLLSPARQAEFLDEVQETYAELLEQIDALGENALEAKTIDLQAETVSETVLKPSSGPSPFEEAVSLEEVTAKSPGRALLPDEVVEAVAETLGETPAGDGPAVQLMAMAREGRNWSQRKIETFLPQARKRIAETLPKAEAARKKAQDKFDAELKRWQDIMEIATPGAIVNLVMPSGEMPGIVIGVERTGKAKNPISLGSWSVSIAVPDSARVMKFTMNRLFPPETVKAEDEKGAEIRQAMANDPSRLFEAFIEARKEGRETRYVFTGNILSGLGEARGSGQISNFTMKDGTTRPGIVMSRGFSFSGFMKTRAIKFKEGWQIRRFLTERPDAEVESSDGYVVLKRERYGHWVIEANASRAKGGRYYTEDAVRKAVGSNEFFKSGKVMRAEVTEDQMVAAADAMKALGAIFSASDHQEVAQAIVNGDVTLGATRSDQTSTPEFRAWFGDSKVVDAEGRPLVVYHATFSDFETFSPDFFGHITEGNASDGELAQTAKVGFWFSTNSDVKDLMAADRMIEAYLSIQEPRSIHLYDLATEISEHGDPRAFVDAMQRKGHDGLAVSDPEFGGVSYVAFSPTQIKSATGNTGTFDPENPSILAATGGLRLAPEEARATQSDIEDAVNIVARVAGKRVKVEFHDKIATADLVADRGLRSDGRGDAGTSGGFYQTISGKALIGLALNDPHYDLKTTAGHEAWHHVERALLTDRERALLRAEMPRLRRFADLEEFGPDQPDYEVTAIAFQRWRRLREEGAPDGGLHIGVRRFFERALQMLRQVANALRGRGYSSFEQIFERARKGEIAARAEETTVPAVLPAQAQREKRGTAPPKGRTMAQIMEIEDRIDQIAQRILGHNIADVALVHDYMADNSYGDYHEGVIRVSMLGDDPVNTLRHEAIHALRRAGIFTEAEWNILSKKSLDRWMDEHGIEDRYAGFYEAEGASPMVAEIMKVEEGVAFAYEAWDMGKYKPPHRIRTIFEKVKAFIEAVRNYLDGLGFQTADDIFGRIEAGEMAARADRAAPYMATGAEPAVAMKRRDPGARSPVFSLMDRSVRKTLARAGRRSLDATRIKIQDRALPIMRVQEEIENELGVKLPVNLDTYMAEGLYYGRAGERLIDLTEKFLDPLIEKLRAAGLTSEDLGDYLYARHAKDRNEWIRSIDPDNEAGSGMTDAEADDILDRVNNSPERAAYEGLAGDVDKLISDTRNTLFRSGLIDREVYDSLRTRWETYVPLRGFEVEESEDPDRPHTGSGFGVKGKEFHQALGRRSKADNPLAYVILQAQQAIVRSEKNRVGKTLMRLVEEHPNASVWKIHKGEVKRRINPGTGLVEKYFAPPAFSHNPHLFPVKIAGKTKWIDIKHPRLARAMSMPGVELWGTALGRGMLKVARTYAALATQWNPEFVFSNFVRDLETALINVTDLDDKPKGLRSQIVKDAVSAKSIRGILSALRGEGKSEYAPWFEEYRLAGGKVSFIETNDVERIKRRIETLQKQGKTLQSLKKVGRLIEDLNSSVENGVRLSVYIAMRKAGVSKDKAAFTARELTVNFNRRGEYGPALNAGWIFFNASIQGTTRIAKALVKSPKVRWAFASIMAAGFAMEFLNAMFLSGDDDDGENAYDKVPDWVKERNIVIMWGKDRLIQIPMAYGYNAPYLAGQQMAAVFRKKRSALEAGATVASAAWDSFNPLGSAPSFAQFVSPTLLDPYIQSDENMNWFGGQIMPKKYDHNKPDSETYFSSAPHWMVDLAKYANWKSGGNVGKSGLIDVSPETIEHYLEFMGSGTAKFMLNAYATGERFLDGQEWLPEKTPFVRRVYNKPTSTSRRREFYEAWDEVYGARYEVKQLAKDGQRDAARTAQAENKAELSVYNVMSKTRKALSALKKQRDTVLEDRTLSGPDRSRRLDEITRRENETIVRALSIYNRVKKAD